METSQLVYDAVVQYWRAYSVPPTIRRVAQLVPCGQTTVYYYLRKLQVMGLILLVDHRPLPVEIKEYLKLFTPKKESV